MEDGPAAAKKKTGSTHSSSYGSHRMSSAAAAETAQPAPLSLTRANAWFAHAGRDYSRSEKRGQAPLDVSARIGCHRPWRPCYARCPMVPGLSSSDLGTAGQASSGTRDRKDPSDRWSLRRQRPSAVLSLDCQIPAVRHGAKMGPNGLQCLGPNAANPSEIVVIDERALGAARLDDPLGKRFADARQLSQLRPAGLIDIDLERGGLRLSPFNLDQASLPAPMDDPPADGGHQSHGHQDGHACLIGPAQKPVRRRNGLVWGGQGHGSTDLIARRPPGYAVVEAPGSHAHGSAGPMPSTPGASFLDGLPGTLGGIIP